MSDNHAVNIKNQLFFWRALLVLTAVFAVSGMLELVQMANSFGIQVIHSRWVYLFILISIAIGADFALFGISWTRWQINLLGWPEVVAGLDKWGRIVAGFVLIALPFIISFAILHPYFGKYYFFGFYSRLALLWCLALTGMFCLRIIRKDLSWLASLGISVMILAVLFRMTVIFSSVNDYPFAHTWSEVSRYFGASLFFGQRLYGGEFPLPLLHPAWDLLLTPPFMFGNLPLWAHRLWQALLQVGLTSALGLAVVKCFGVNGRLNVWYTAGWAFLYLLQGPILIQLLVCALIVVVGARPVRFWRTTLIVLAASVWAGLCRINWFPVPALIASGIYLLEIPVMNPKRWLTYIWKPFFWFGLGTLAAVASNVFYRRWSGNGNGGTFTSSLTSDLLWYRLLPNPTYPHGVLLDLLLVSIPMILIIVLVLRQERGAFHPIRLAGILGILLVLCAGGVVVSAKIGGGADLHNMDAFLIVLMLVGGYIFFGHFTPEAGISRRAPLEFSFVRSLLLILAVTVPVLATLLQGIPLFTWDQSRVDSALAVIKDRAETVSAQGGEVLFISQRQLLALKMVDVPLVPEYEQDFLMEMVMSHNRIYLDQFQADLRAQRFAMIVADNQNIHYYGKTGVFGEENDLWVQEVSIPMLCYYYPVSQPGDLGIALFVPREEGCK